MNKLISAMVVALSLSLSHTVLASNGQSFSGINYANPAMYVLTKHTQLLAGGNILNLKIPFDGTVAGSPPFSANSNKTLISPYFRIAQRLSDKVVVAVDLYEPYRIKIAYPQNSPAGFINSNLDIRSFDIAPSVAVQAKKWLALGGGIDIVYRTADYDLVIPTPLAPRGALLQNHGNDWALGWHAGAVLFFNQTTFLGLSYHSKITNHLLGTSRYLSLRSPAKIKIYIPALATVTLTKVINKNWVVVFILNHSQWDVMKVAPLQTAIGPIPLTFNYKNTWHYAVFTRYHLTKNFALQGLVSQDNTPTNNKDRNLVFPEGNNLTFGAGFRAHLPQHFIVDFLGAYSINSNKIRLCNPMLAQIGKAKNKAVIGQLQLEYDL